MRKLSLACHAMCDIRIIGQWPTRCSQRPERMAAGQQQGSTLATALQPLRRPACITPVWPRPRSVVLRCQVRRARRARGAAQGPAAQLRAAGHGLHDGRAAEHEEAAALHAPRARAARVGGHEPVPHVSAQGGRLCSRGARVGPYPPPPPMRNSIMDDDDDACMGCMHQLVFTLVTAVRLRLRALARRKRLRRC